MNPRDKTDSQETTKRVLVMEDEDLLRWCIGFELKRRGYEVELAKDLASAGRIIQRFRPDLIVSDQHLPDGKGLRLVAGWNDSNPGAEAIIITAYTPPTLDEMKRARTRLCLSKPFELDTLCSLIKSYLGQ